MNAVFLLAIVCSASFRSDPPRISLFTIDVCSSGVLGTRKSAGLGSPFFICDKESPTLCCVEIDRDGPATGEDLRNHSAVALSFGIDFDFVNLEVGGGLEHSPLI